MTVGRPNGPSTRSGVSRMEPQRVDFGLDLGRLLLQQLGVRLQLFAAETSRIAARRVEPLEFELEQRAQGAVGVRGGDVPPAAALTLAPGRTRAALPLNSPSSP